MAGTPKSVSFFAIVAQAYINDKKYLTNVIFIVHKHNLNNTNLKKCMINYVILLDKRVNVRNNDENMKILAMGNIRI